MNKQQAIGALHIELEGLTLKWAATNRFIGSALYMEMPCRHQLIHQALLETLGTYIKLIEMRINLLEEENDS